MPSAEQLIKVLVWFGKPVSALSWPSFSSQSSPHTPSGSWTTGCCLQDSNIPHCSEDLSTTASRLVVTPSFTANFYFYPSSTSRTVPTDPFNHSLPYQNNLFKVKNWFTCFSSSLVHGTAFSLHHLASSSSDKLMYNQEDIVRWLRCRTFAFCLRVTLRVTLTLILHSTPTLINLLWSSKIMLNESLKNTPQLLFCICILQIQCQRLQLQATYFLSLH